MNTMQQIGDLTGRKFAALGTSSQLEAALAGEEEKKLPTASLDLITVSSVLGESGSRTLYPKTPCIYAFRITDLGCEYSDYVRLAVTVGSAGNVTSLSLSNAAKGEISEFLSSSERIYYMKCPSVLTPEGDRKSYFYQYIPDSGAVQFIGTVFLRYSAGNYSSDCSFATPPDAVKQAIYDYMIAQGYWAE